MPDVKVVAATLQVDTGTSNANIKEVNKNLSDVKTSLKDTDATATATGKSIETSTGNFGKLKETMAGLPGPLGQAGEGVKKLDSTFKSLLANPVILVIAAIVAGLALLYKAFVNTFEGGEKMEQVFAGIKAAAQSLIDSLGRIASAAVKLFHFDFSGAVDEIKGVAKAASDAYNAMAKLTAEAQNLAREQSTNDLEQAQRAKQLAILREQATDSDVPVAKRKAALKELQVASEQNAKEDIDLAKRVADNKIAQLTLEKDGAKKNFVEIQKIKIDQVNVETQNANELRRIGKQITAADKEEAAQRSENAKAAAEAAKANRQKLLEANNTLRKLQQENEILSIKDGYQKELKQLEIQISEEKRLNLLAFNDRKLTKAQYHAIQLELDKKANAETLDLTTKHNEDIAKKEEAFQKELNAILNKTKLNGLKDSREIEKVQLQIGYEEKLQDAITRYKDDQLKFQAIKTALDAQLKADQDKIDAKNKKEDDKKKFDLDIQAQKEIVDKVNFDFAAKIAAVDREQVLIQKAFDDKLISELDYNNKVAELAGKRQEIADLETAHKRSQVEEVVGILENLASIVGKQTIAGKALGIATALINTYQGASEAIKQKSTLPSPFDVVAKVVNVAAIISTGLKTVKAITAVQVPGGGGGGSISTPSISAGAPAAPIAPTQSTTQLDQTSLNKIGNATTRAYVLDSDVANHRERNERLNRAARLGG